MLKKGKVYMSKDEELRVEIILLHYNTPVAGYEDKWKTMELVTRIYWYLGVTKEVEKYMEGCGMYQQIKNRMEVLTGKLKLSKISEKLWIHLMIDFITKLLLVARKDVIIVVYDMLLKIIYFMATAKGTSVEELERLFRDNV